jgi:hypothetical protein
MVSMIRCFLLVAGLLLVLPTPAAPQVRSIDALEVIVLPQPSWERPESRGTGAWTLKALSAKPNKITDEKEWLEQNGLDLDRFEPESVPAEIPHAFQGSPLAQALYGSEGYLVFYGKGYAGARYVVGMAKDGTFLGCIDTAPNCAIDQMVLARECSLNVLHLASVSRREPGSGCLIG